MAIKITHKFTPKPGTGSDVMKTEDDSDAMRAKEPTLSLDEAKAIVATKIHPRVTGGSTPSSHPSRSLRHE